MTQATEVEVLKRLDAIATDVQEIKLSQVRTEERLSSVDQRLDRLEKRVDSQDSRLWGFVAAAFLTVLGFLAKLAFFPGGTA